MNDYVKMLLTSIWPYIHLTLFFCIFPPWSVRQLTLFKIFFYLTLVTGNHKFCSTWWFLHQSLLVVHPIGSSRNSDYVSKFRLNLYNGGLWEPFFFMHCKSSVTISVQITFKIDNYSEVLTIQNFLNFWKSGVVLFQGYNVVFKKSHQLWLWCASFRALSSQWRWNQDLNPHLLKIEFCRSNCLPHWVSYERAYVWRNP